MAFRCPYCAHQMAVKVPKAGRFTPKCTACKRPFVLLVSETGEFAAEGLPEYDVAPSAPPPPPKPPARSAPTADPEATGEFIPMSAGRLRVPSPPASDPEATGEFAPSKPAPAKKVIVPVDSEATGEFMPTKSPPAKKVLAATDIEATGEFVPQKIAPLPPRKAPSAAADIEATGEFVPQKIAPLPPRKPVRPADATETDRTGVYAEPDTDRTGVHGAANEEPTEAGPDRSAKTRVGSNKTVAGAKPTASDETPDDMPKSLGGYEILKELGRGGMGAVYLARQVSLDRNVALKVMNTRLASDPVFVARFVREAFAAAQLVHHNVVQIYDIGSDGDVQFFSMEFVEGESLNQLIKREGKLDTELAVGYILQACRGLKFGHDQDLIHRDIKPDNLMLNKHGVVKVADLGLVKGPGTTDEAPSKPLPPGGSGSVLKELSANVTSANIAMGTPAYMSPEQCRDAASVDHRADIYSLGCTLYVLLTGRPPFQGKTAYEVMSKHATEQIVPPEMIVTRVPKSISALLLKMVAKDPNDRFNDLGEVIAALEDWLGVQSTGPFTPREEHLQVLESCVQRFDTAPAARLRNRLIPGLWIVGVLSVALSVLAGYPLIASGLVGFIMQAAAAYFVLSGFAGRTYLFRKTRQYVFGSSFSEWLLVLGGAAALVIVLSMTGMIWAWLAVSVVALLLAVTLYVLIDRPLAKQRFALLEEAEELFKQLRIRGLDEDALRQFIWKFGGTRVEEFYEALFGYEGKLAARQWVNPSEERKPKARYAAWRDPLLRWMESQQKARAEARARRLLEKAEEKALKAQGVSAAQARERAEEAADAAVEQAAEMKTIAARPTAKKADLKAIRAVAVKAVTQKTTTAKPKRARRTLSQRIFRVVFDPRPRVLLGGALIVLMLLWMNQNGLLAHLGGTPAGTGAAMKPLRLPLMPEFITNWIDYYHVGLAGLFLLLSTSLSRPFVLLAFVIPAVLVTLAGPQLGMPDVLGTGSRYWLSMAAGGILMALAWLLDRFRAE